jgi:FKBP-type peptidyl-prolyl cis-trans isomerase FkpA/FKBP-type peptidyl-prolyl cis-trans isomerase FklB
MGKMFTAAIVLVLAVVTLAGAASVKLDTDDQKTLYALGLALSQNLKLFNLSEAEMEFVKAGLTDGAVGAKPQVDLQAYGPKVQQLHQERSAQVAALEKKAGQTFLDKAASEKGATKTPSGLVITTLKPGNGAAPKPTDNVKVHYHGTLVDGSVFDSSVQRGQPATFPLNGVIKCWTEGVGMMKVGGKSRLVCPPELAYGDRGAPPRIKPGSTLVFEVELLEIVAAAPATPSPSTPRSTPEGKGAPEPGKKK